MSISGFRTKFESERTLDAQKFASNIRPVGVALMRQLIQFLVLCCNLFALGGRAETNKATVSLGPLYDLFPLTLSSGHRTEVAGPLYYHELKETQETWGIPPLFTYVRDPDVESAEADLLYPLVSYDRYGEEYRLHFLQLINFAGGQTQQEDMRRRFTIFPFYFQQRSTQPEENYTALLPFYGRLQNRLFRDEIRFILLPLYVQSRKKDVVTDNYVYPFFHLRHGNSLEGWQLWPIAGHEHKAPTTRTNSLDEVEIVGGHDKFFAPWLLFMKSEFGIGTTNFQRQLLCFPFYSSTRSTNRDSTSYGWPIGVTITDDREKKFREVGAPWPLVVFARGDGKRVSRVWPFYSHGTNATMQSDFYLWPLYKYNRFHSDPLDRERTRVLFFLYSDITEKNTQTGDSFRRTDLWPFFTKRRTLDGNERLQILSILEPLLPNSKSIERNYSPLWSLWRSEKNAKTDSTSQSLLWNLYRRDVTPDSRKTSLLFGLFQSSKNAEGRRWRLFYIPFGNKKPDGATEKTPVETTNP